MSTVIVKRKPSEKEIAKLYWLLNDIASDANTLRSVCLSGLESGRTEEMLCAAESVAEKIGWLADHGGTLITGGEPEGVGDALDWCMRPSYNDASGLEEKG